MHFILNNNTLEKKTRYIKSLNKNNMYKNLYNQTYYNNDWDNKNGKINVNKMKK